MQEPTSPPLRTPLSNSASPRSHEPDTRDLEKLQKWQQDRITRKLRGEYESYVSHLSQLVNDSLSTPLRISSVRVEGANNTRESFLGSLINPFLSSHKTQPLSDEEQALQSVLHAARNICNKLHETDIFNSISVSLERSRDPLAHETDVDLILKTREKGRLYLKTATESLAGHVRNVFGGAETLEAHLSLGTTTRRSFNASFTAPLTAALQTRGELSIFGMERDNTSYASSTEGIRGIKVAVRTGSIARGIHAFNCETVARHVAGLTSNASLSIREAAGHTSKCSLSHSWTRDTRDDKVTATRGAYTKFNHEFAGFGGDASFYKTEAEGQLSRRLLPGLTVSFAARTGLLWTLGNKPSLFPDRFQLGGPTSVRLFRANGLGPRDGADSLGGDLHWSVGLSLISDIPRKPHWPTKTHLFVNAGRLDSINKSRSLTQSIAEGLLKPSISLGVGLIHRFDPIRVELNCGVPLVASASDRTRRGLQVGMGLEFL